VHEQEDDSDSYSGKKDSDSYSGKKDPPLLPGVGLLSNPNSDSLA